MAITVENIREFFKDPVRLVQSWGSQTLGQELGGEFNGTPDGLTKIADQIANGEISPMPAFDPGAGAWKNATELGLNIPASASIASATVDDKTGFYLDALNEDIVNEVAKDQRLSAALAAGDMRRKHPEIAFGLTASLPPGLGEVLPADAEQAYETFLFTTYATDYNTTPEMIRAALQEESPLESWAADRDPKLKQAEARDVVQEAMGDPSLVKGAPVEAGLGGIEGQQGLLLPAIDPKEGPLELTTLAPNIDPMVTAGPSTDFTGDPGTLQVQPPPHTPGEIYGMLSQRTLTDEVAVEMLLALGDSDAMNTVARWRSMIDIDEPGTPYMGEDGEWAGDLQLRPTDSVMGFMHQFQDFEYDDSVGWWRDRLNKQNEYIAHMHPKNQYYAVNQILYGPRATSPESARDLEQNYLESLGNFALTVMMDPNYDPMKNEDDELYYQWARRSLEDPNFWTEEMEKKKLENYKAYVEASKPGADADVQWKENPAERLKELGKAKNARALMLAFNPAMQKAVSVAISGDYGGRGVLAGIRRQGHNIVDDKYTTAVAGLPVDEVPLLNAYLAGQEDSVWARAVR